MPVSSIKRNTRGFTLVEIMAVLVIIGLGVFLTTVSLSDAPPKYRLTSTARKIGSIIRQARTQAISSGEFYVVDIPTDGRQILIYPERRIHSPGTFPEDRVRSTGGAGSETIPSEHPVTRYTLSEHVRIQDNVSSETAGMSGKQGKIIISPSGQIRAHTLKLIGKDGLEITVVPNPATGTIQYLNNDADQSLVIQDDRPDPE